MIGPYFRIDFQSHAGGGMPSFLLFFFLHPKFSNCFVVHAQLQTTLHTHIYSSCKRQPGRITTIFRKAMVDEFLIGRVILGPQADG